MDFLTSNTRAVHKPQPSMHERRSRGMVVPQRPVPKPAVKGKIEAVGELTVIAHDKETHTVGVLHEAGTLDSKGELHIAETAAVFDDTKVPVSVMEKAEHIVYDQAVMEKKIKKEAEKEHHGTMQITYDEAVLHGKLEKHMHKQVKAQVHASQAKREKLLLTQSSSHHDSTREERRQQLEAYFAKKPSGCSRCTDTKKCFYCEHRERSESKKTSHKAKMPKHMHSACGKYCSSKHGGYKKSHHKYSGGKHDYDFLMCDRCSNSPTGTCDIHGHHSMSLSERMMKKSSGHHVVHHPEDCDYCQKMPSGGKKHHDKSHKMHSGEFNPEHHDDKTCKFCILTKSQEYDGKCKICTDYSCDLCVSMKSLMRYIKTYSNELSATIHSSEKKHMFNEATKQYQMKLIMRLRTDPHFKITVETVKRDLDNIHKQIIE